MILSSKMSRLAVGFCLITFGTFGNAQTLIPFEKWQQSRSEWEKDPTEVAYAVLRCGTLFDFLGRVFTENGTTPEQRSNGQTLTQWGGGLIRSGAALSISAGMDETRILERAQAFFDIYGRQIVENRRLHNDMFQGWIGEDFKFCIGRYRFMEDMGKRISGPKD